jgi:cytidine deaminase
MHRVFYKANNVLKKANILSFGFNRMGDINLNEAGVHAEHDVINKLKPLERKKKLEPINLLVIRFSKNNKLQNSKPCANCIQTMKTLPQKKGYKVKNIYYSNDNGDIIKSNLKNLENEELHYSRFYKLKNINT